MDTISKDNALVISGVLVVIYYVVAMVGTFLHSFWMGFAFLSLFIVYSSRLIEDIKKGRE